MSFLITGGAGFIGSHFVDLIMEKLPESPVIVLDKLTYAGSLHNLEKHLKQKNFLFIKEDISNYQKVLQLLKEFKITRLINFAAESHVDKSIDSPFEFVSTNVLGVAALLQSAKNYIESEKIKDFKFVQVSTDEVYGSLDDDRFFVETSPLDPSSPYSASKAGGDLLINAWARTYKIPTVVTRCSNNYGPRQYPEKLIPVVITNAINERPIPVYGNGKNVRDWIHVKDHAEGIFLAMEKKSAGEIFLFGGKNQLTNIFIVKTICNILDNFKPRSNGRKYDDLIQFVTDRKGHDYRYAIDPTKSEKDLGFKNKISFESGLAETIKWYLANEDWCQKVRSDKK